METGNTQQQQTTTTTITCYHGYELTRVEMLGIVSYLHPNGASCQHMNRLDVSVDDLLASIVHCHGIVMRPDVTAAISCSKKARFVVYKMLSSADSIQLPIMLQDYYKIIGLVSLQSNYEMVTELVSVFGRAMVENIIKVIGVDCSSMLKHSDSDRLTIIALTDKDVRLSGEAQKKNKKLAVATASTIAASTIKKTSKNFDAMMDSKTLEEEMDDDSYEDHPF